MRNWVTLVPAAKRAATHPSTLKLATLKSTIYTSPCRRQHSMVSDHHSRRNGSMTSFRAVQIPGWHSTRDNPDHLE
eukprot:2305343-Amphidinium_carterae.1